MLTPFKTNLSELWMLFREYLTFLSKTKNDESFSDKQFCLNNSRTFQKDRKRNGEGSCFM